MLLQTIVLPIGLALAVSAGVIKLQERQVATIPIPDACTTQCTGFQQIASQLGSGQIPPCTTETQDNIVTCYACIETSAPDELSPTALTYAQTSMNNLQTACNNMGSPLPDVSIPGATGTTTLPTAIGGVPTLPVGLTTSSTIMSPGGLTASPVSSGSVAPSPTTTTRSEASALTPRILGATLMVAFTAMILVA
ncbi:hypothetical protein M408DRAFT_19286 [Serendipita vermifera MAFF 305830]|uniref:Extracellular membrane protein CFEM domain-containing protein n=1 Tax=Serendipita vermifera MAFF 305830 TaxID=933852 RepID=A0A0C2XZT2_SERVB|nr:hypothetical protein M408DRAFT_19286 [Serendipita vermifera MAFF 305830]